MSPGFEPAGRVGLPSWRPRPCRCPLQPKWPLMVAGCLRRVGRLEEALLKYRQVRRPWGRWQEGNRSSQPGLHPGICLHPSPLPALAALGHSRHHHRPPAPLCATSPTPAGLRHGPHQHRGAALPGPAQPGESGASVPGQQAELAGRGGSWHPVTNAWAGTAWPTSLSSHSPNPCGAALTCTLAGVWAGRGCRQVLQRAGPPGAPAGSRRRSPCTARGAAGRPRHGGAAAHQRPAGGRAAEPAARHGLRTAAAAAAARVRSVCWCEQWAAAAHGGPGLSCGRGSAHIQCVCSRYWCNNRRHAAKAKAAGRRGSNRASREVEQGTGVGREAQVRVGGGSGTGGTRGLEEAACGQLGIFRAQPESCFVWRRPAREPWLGPRPPGAGWRPAGRPGSRGGRRRRPRVRGSPSRRWPCAPGSRAPTA